jgi:hypothetical protein
MSSSSPSSSDASPKLGRYVALGILLFVGALACLIQVGTLPQSEKSVSIDVLSSETGGPRSLQVTCTSLRSPNPAEDGFVEASELADSPSRTVEEALVIRDACDSERAATAGKIAMYAGGGGFLGALGLSLLVVCHLLRANSAQRAG